MVVESNSPTSSWTPVRKKVADDVPLKLAV